MGLINNPTTRRKLVSFISRFNSPLCVICYVVGLLGFLALAYAPYNAKTYFSENALLPGWFSWAFNRIPAAWFESKFRSIGVDTHVQNFTFEYPEGLVKDQRFPGQNVYGILRAPRAASTEALVMTAPYRPLDSAEKTAGGIALMLSLANAFRKKTYWAKDIIFLVTEFDQLGMKAWLNAYHHCPTPYIHAGELTGRSGAIQAAINIEIAGDSISSFNIKSEGLNGQLPNLDLINTVVLLCHHGSITPTVHERADHLKPASQSGFIHSLQTMMLMMMTQASGSPSGNHGLFLPFHIEAVTIQGVKMKTGQRFSLNKIGDVVEGLFRSLNNLLERFHQSFFFYLLPATERYVSIGLYMPPFGVMALPLIIKVSDRGLLPLLPSLILSTFFGILSFNTTRFFVESAEAFHLSASDSILLGALAILIAAIAYPKLLKRKSPTSGADWRLMKCMGLLATALVLGALALMNISLAYFVAAVWTPVLVTAKPHGNRFAQLLQVVLLLAVSPLFLICVASFAYTLIFTKVASDPRQVMTQSLDLASKGFFSSVMDFHLFGNWTFALYSCAFVPIWALFWGLIWTPAF
ncbi:hypothetical protein CAPTEDRAFT_223994 [Capitella teleta]|uniref:GPI-anchor transamidase component GPAA1 n=1 Tax=Capitella teleta TaxID=283909 RepID=R7THA2_CAPTE|nr:hypothetical protein CAPTEDRAFT_223994 [Capitella teleta]|eukprot:ELT93188.1 hypothetical protein CAPTEDRAFT_223994 [Capitella teleta]